MPREADLMNATVEIHSEYMTARELHQKLEAIRGTAVEYTLQLSKRPSRWRGIDQNILLAVVSLTSGALGALITGLLKIAEKKQDAYVELSGENWSVKVPAGTPVDELQRLVELAKSKRAEQITLAV